MFDKQHKNYPEVVIRWLPSGLGYYYDPKHLVKIEGKELAIELEYIRKTLAKTLSQCKDCDDFVEFWVGDYWFCGKCSEKYMVLDNRKEHMQAQIVEWLKEMDKRYPRWRVR